MASTNSTHSKRLERKPRVFVTRHLMPSVEDRMVDLFDVVLNADDNPLTRDDLTAAMKDCDVLVPTVTDRIDTDMITAAGKDLGLIANFGAGTEHIDLEAAAERHIPIRQAHSLTILLILPWLGSLACRAVSAKVSSSSGVVNGPAGHPPRCLAQSSLERFWASSVWAA